jgi:amino acid permease
MSRFRLTDENNKYFSVFVFIFGIVNILYFLSIFIPGNFNLLFLAIDAVIIIVFLLIYFINKIISKIKDNLEVSELAKNIGWEKVKMQKEEKEKISEEEFKKINVILDNYVSKKDERKAAIKRFFE